MTYAFTFIHAHTFIYSGGHNSLVHWVLSYVSLQLFSLDYNQASYNTHVVVLILYISGGSYSLKSIPNDRFY